MARASGARPIGKRSAGTSSRSKREDILAAAADHFGRQGYEDTKWADIAADVGVGSTALYHYFESKLHCLFEIMSDDARSFRVSFDEVTRANERFEDGLPRCPARELLALTEAEVPAVPRARRRAGPAEPAAAHRPRGGGPPARALTRPRARDRLVELPFARHGDRRDPRGRPQLLTRALLGLYNSVWHWYRPRGTLSLPDVDAFYVPADAGDRRARSGRATKFAAVKA